MDIPIVNNPKITDFKSVVVKSYYTMNKNVTTNETTIFS